MQPRRSTVEVRFSQLEHLSDAQRTSLEVRAIAHNETPVLRADRESRREELETIREVLRAADIFWKELGVEGSVARETQFVPVQAQTLARHVAAQPEFHQEQAMIVHHNHVYYPFIADERDRIRQLTHETSHLAAKHVLQIESKSSVKAGEAIDTTAKVRHRKEGGRFAAAMWEDDLETRGFEGYHEAIMELIASEVRHVLYDARGVADDDPERIAVATPSAHGPAPRLIERIMDVYVQENPGVTRRQLKDEAYLDARNGTYHFIRRLHAWRPKYIKPLAQMGLTWMSMRDTAQAVGDHEFARLIEKHRVEHGLE